MPDQWFTPMEERAAQGKHPIQVKADLAQEVAEWLHYHGIPFDITPSRPPPKSVLRALIQLYADTDGETFEAYAWAIEEEAGWFLGEELGEERGTTPDQ